MSKYVPGWFDRIGHFHKRWQSKITAGEVMAHPYVRAFMICMNSKSKRIPVKTKYNAVSVVAMRVAVVVTAGDPGAAGFGTFNEKVTQMAETSKRVALLLDPSVLTWTPPDVVAGLAAPGAAPGPPLIRPVDWYGVLDAANASLPGGTPAAWTPPAAPPTVGWAAYDIASNIILQRLLLSLFNSQQALGTFFSSRVLDTLNTLKAF